MQLLNLKTFNRLFGVRPTDVESRSQALHQQRAWLEQAAERKRRQDNLVALANELDLERTAKLPRFDRFTNGTRVSGFTLVELMIVVGIIAVLMAAALPVYQSYIARSQAAEGPSLAATLQQSITEYWQNNGAFPSTCAVAGLTTAGQCLTQGKYVSGIQIETGGVQITYGNGATAPLTGKQLYLTPYVAADGVTILWQCGNENPPSTTIAPAAMQPVTVVQPVGATTVPDAYLPSNCRTNAV